MSYECLDPTRVIGMSSCCRIIVFMVEKESDSILGFHMSDDDFCCCLKCTLFDLPDRVKNHFMNYSFYNIEVTVSHDLSGNCEVEPIGKLSR